MAGLIKRKDGKTSCWWPGEDEQYIRYHDQEWGRPVSCDRTLFEKMCLEGFQAGLSWLTILRKRENFRAAFANFEHEKIARFTETDIEHLLQNEGIIRHRGKIEATINNARLIPDIVEEFGSFAAYIWRFEPQNHHSPKQKSDVQAVTEDSKALSKDLKKRGFKFVGPTTMYALMQAMGMINDHIQGCHIHTEIEKTRQTFVRPL